MNRSRQVPGIAQQRQGFSPGSLGAVQSPLAMGQPQQQRQYEMVMGQPPPPTQAEVIAEQMHELAATIYCELATKYIEGIQGVRHPDPDALRRMAGHAQTAAKAYFEAMGVQF